MPPPALSANLLPIEGTATSRIVARLLKLGPEKGAGVLVGLTQVVNIDDHFLPRVLSLFKTTAHVQGIIRAGLDAEATEHTSIDGDVEQLQAVFVTLGWGGLAWGGNYLDNPQRAVLGA